MTHPRHMGRGANPNLGPAVATRGGEEGEIAMIDADRLEDHAAVSIEAETFAGDADDQAIANVATKLRRTAAARKLSDDEVEDQAINLYNKLCDLVRSGAATAAQESQAAALFGEPLAELQARLKTDDESADEDPSAGIASLLSGLN